MPATLHGPAGTDTAVQVTVTVPGAQLALSGRLDATHTGPVRDAVAAALADGTGELYIILTDVSYVDASGLGVLVGADRAARHCGRRAVLVDVPARGERLLRATRLTTVLTRIPTLPPHA